MKSNAAMICSLAVTASFLAAQAPNLVRLSVTALDASGEPVEDLKASDFQISDQGKAQKIAFFRHNPAAPPALGANDFSNRTGSAPHSTVILFDLMNQNQSDRLTTWHLLGKSLQQLESGESLYFYLLTLEGTLSPLHAISKGAADDKTWVQGFEKVLDKAMKAASHAPPAGQDQEMVVKKTYVALETLANQMIVLPGRRDIVWVTSSTPNVWNPKNPCPGDWVDCALYVPHLAVTLAGDNVAVDPLSYTGSPSPDLNRDFETVAGLTGGWSYFGEDIRSVLKQVTRDGLHNYTIYYEPSADNWDTKFHKIRATTERKGLKLRMKQRYYALADKRPDMERQAPVLRAVFQSPADDPSIGLRVNMTTAAGKAAHLQIHVDASDLRLREDGETFSGGLTFLISDMDAAGPKGDPMLNGMPLHLTREQNATAMKEGVSIVQDHPIPDGIQKLRVIVLDQGLNVAGSLTIPLGK
jgi:VWFA-related protein